jgi:hypothetical protein
MSRPKRAEKPSPLARSVRKETLRLITKLSHEEPVSGGCATYTGGIVEALRQASIDAVDMVGSFWHRDGVVAIHHWVGLPTGEWVDPTSAQFGLPDCLILPLGDFRRRLYKGPVIHKQEAIDHLARDLHHTDYPTRIYEPVIFVRGREELQHAFGEMFPSLTTEEEK